MQKFKVLVCAVITIIGLSMMISAQQPGDISLQPFLSGLSSPLYMTNAKDGSNRLFVVEQGGVIKVIQPGSTTPSVFINISSKVLNNGEQGLLGLAFHPNFANNGYFFVDYTRVGDGATVIERYKASGNTGDAGSGRIILVIPQPFSNHNGGTIEFKRDGNADNLYIGMGDGGSGNDPGNRAQNINVLLGKFLRITPDVSGNASNPPYTVPADNPFVGRDGADEIFAVGVRNPFRWSFDRATGELWAGDVGQNDIEEFDVITNGGNYGWRVYEGTQCTNIDFQQCNPNNFIPPIGQYRHSEGRCSITGGFVYRGTRGTFANDAYTYGDFCTSELFVYNNRQSVNLLATGISFASFGEDEAGELYAVNLQGSVSKFVNSNPIVSSKTNSDFNGDSKTDLSVFRPSNGTWYARNFGGQDFLTLKFGANGDIPAAEDFDGDSRTDLAVFRPSNGVWYVMQSSDNTVTATQFGSNGDVPVAGNYDNDDKADIAVFRPSTNVWYVLNSSNSQARIVQFGSNGDVPTASDFDGDGRTDISVFRPSNGVWYRLNSSDNNFAAVQFGSNGDVPAQGDFDGDNKTDQAVFRPSNGTWYILRSSNNSVGIVQFGASGDIPVVGDYEGDNKDDIAVFRPSNGVWYVLQSSNSQAQSVKFGQSGDLPIPRYDAP